MASKPARKKSVASKAAARPPARKPAAKSAARPGGSAATQLAAFAAKYLPAIARQFKDADTKMRKRLPGAYCMVYDNWNGLVIGYSPTSRPSDALFSILAQPDHVTLCFIQGAKLKDPVGILRGAGNQVRNVRLVDGITVDEPALVRLMDQAMGDDLRMRDAANVSAKDRLAVRSVSAKQRPRRP